MTSRCNEVSCKGSLRRSARSKDSSQLTLDTHQENVVEIHKSKVSLSNGSPSKTFASTMKFLGFIDTAWFEDISNP
ncbi:hypothetical protein F8M41_017778 [Gigaspora margarita]|uniref:Uncharacterized protein n=1 Tax=Gigaspora margarita TaxID=4874 RepID=A0A8H4ELU1_GIGMA|nr:hypothetical protein F8M41_017778 [Gigaspora margarita]